MKFQRSVNFLNEARILEHRYLSTNFRVFQNQRIMERLKNKNFQVNFFFFIYLSLSSKLKLYFNWRKVGLKTEQIAISGEELFQSPLFLRISCYGRVSFLLFGRGAQKTNSVRRNQKSLQSQKSLHVSQLTRTGPVRLAANGRATLAFRSG